METAGFKKTPDVLMYVIYYFVQRAAGPRCVRKGGLFRLRLFQTQYRIY